MRKPQGIGAVVLGVVGLLLCATAVGVGWWAALKSIDRMGRLASRLDQALSEADVRLAGVESRINSICSDLNKVRAAGETIAGEKPDLPHVRAKTDQLLDSLVPAVDRADAIADSLRSVAAGLRATADIVDQFSCDLQATVRVRSAADSIDGAAEALSGIQAKVDAVKPARAAQSPRALVTLAGEAIAGSKRLAEGLTAVRQEIAFVRGWAAEWREEVVLQVYFAATANTLVWLWGGLGQLCLIGWGRRRLGGRAAAPDS